LATQVMKKVEKPSQALIRAKVAALMLLG
jgi:hypothetical protein